ncbi:type ISP restriction/modification enzyme [Solibacillus sp. FSL R7-0682]|uniref:type ISP restriction/modification enzyme n=1 Tax=Solibacillus sp. FSL R7-0682 TaxID=2921690 RepID=UPI0030F4FA87
MLNKKIVKDYLISFLNFYTQGTESGSATPELTYRPAISNFFTNLLKNLNIEKKINYIHEPSSTGQGRPDYLFHNINDYGVYGYIETKYVTSTQIQVTEFEEQLKKYAQLNVPLILTDGLEFIFFKADGDILDLENFERVCLVTSKLDFLQKKKINLSLDSLEKFDLEISEFFSESNLRTLINNEVISLFSRKTALMKSEIQKIINIQYPDPLNLELHSNLSNIYNNFKATLDSSLNNEYFSSLCAQLLNFSLLSRYIELKINKKEITVLELELINSSILLQNYTPLNTLMTYIKNNKLSPIATTWYSLANILTKIKFDYIDLIENIPDFHTKFYKQYDLKEKDAYGAYITPNEVVQYWIRFLNDLSNKFLDKDLFDRSLSIIDPCCGTNAVHYNLTEFTNVLGKKLECTFIGLEILPAPLFMGWIRLSKFSNLDTFKTYLCNSLIDDLNCNEESSSDLSDAYMNTIKSEISRKFNLIIASPPSSDESILNTGENFKFVNNIIEKFKIPSELRSSRQNIQKSLQNDFVKFIAWSMSKTVEGQSMISLNVPSSLLTEESYLYLRKYLIDKFKIIYVLEYDSDLRKNSGNNQNINNTRQGRVLITLVDVPTNAATTKLYYKDISCLSITERRKWFNDNNDFSEYLEYEIQTKNYLLKPVQVEKNSVDLYSNKFISLDSIFKNNVSGVKTACTALVVQNNEDLVLSILEEFKNEKISDEYMFNKYFQKQGRNVSYATGWKRAYTAREISDNFIRENIVPYNFRPFLKRSIFYAPSVMNEASNGGARYRPELQKLYLESHVNQTALAIAKKPSSLSTSIVPFTYVIDSLTDNDLAKRGNSYIYPIYYYREGIITNIDEKVIRTLNSLFYNDETPNYESIALDLISYIYIISSSSYFLETFSDILYYQITNESIKVPITSDKDFYLTAVSLGHQLIESQSSYIRNTANLRDLLKFDGNIDFLLSNIKIDSNNGSIKLQDENNKVKFSINNIPKGILTYNIKGYDVVKTWFKFNTYLFTHQKFTKTDLENVIIFLESLYSYLQIVESSDSLVEQIVNSKLISF